MLNDHTMNCDVLCFLYTNLIFEYSSLLKSKVKQRLFSSNKMTKSAKNFS